MGKFITFILLFARGLLITLIGTLGLANIVLSAITFIHSLTISSIVLGILLIFLSIFFFCYGVYTITIIGMVLMIEKVK